MPAQQMNESAIAIARSHQNVPWCDDYKKMISSMLFDPNVSTLANSRYQTRIKTLEFNQLQPGKMDLDKITAKRQALLKDMLGKIGSTIFIEPPFTVDYGCNVSLGEGFFANFNTVILDSGLVQIGDRVLFGPNVSIFASSHETSILSRRRGVELGLPVTIGDDCWIGGNVIILGGVTIGDGCTIGAGAVVTRDIPAYSVAVGSPAKVVKKVLSPEEEEKLEASQHSD